MQMNLGGRETLASVQAASSYYNGPFDAPLSVSGDAVARGVCVVFGRCFLRTGHAHSLTHTLMHRK